MSEQQWLKYCFAWWSGIGEFTLDLESYRMADMSERIPPEGWVP